MSFGPASIEYYPSWARAMAYDPEPIPGEIMESEFSIQGDTLYAVSRGRLDSYSLLTGALVSSVTLERDISTRDGMSITDDGLLVINEGFGGERGITIFDASTGAYIRELTPHLDRSWVMRGLVCKANP